MAQAGRTASNNTTAAGLSTTIMNSLGSNPFWLDYTSNPVTASYNTGMALFALSATGITMRTDSRLIPPVNNLLSQQAGGGNWPPVAYSVGFTTGTAGLVTLLKPPATITLSGLSHTYDGTAKSATAITSPSGLTNSITYSPSTPPLAAGSYTATGTIQDGNYDAIPATGTLSIA